MNPKKLDLSWKQISYYLLDALNYHLDENVSLDEFLSTINENEIPQSFKDETNNALDSLDSNGLVEVVEPGKIIEGPSGAIVHEQIIRIKQ